MTLTVGLAFGLSFGCAAGSADDPSGGAGAGAGPSGGFIEEETTTALCEDAAAARTSVGCDYYATFLDAKWAADNGCFVAFVANTSNEPARIEVTFGDQEIDLSTFAKVPVGSGPELTYEPFDAGEGLPPGEVAILFLAGSYQPLEEGENTTNAPVPCPVPAAIPAGAQLHGTGFGQAFHIKTTTPVVAYQMLPYGGGAAAVTGATLLIPSTAWDTDYVAMNAYGGDVDNEFGSGPSMTLVAREDDTSVTIVPKSILGAGPSVSPVAAGTPATFTLARGQTLQFTQTAELTGSPIKATKPIGLFAGHQCTDTPTGAQYCDHAEQQIPAVSALGFEYVAAPFRPRLGTPENLLYRVVSAAEGTTLSFDPPIASPKTLAFGEILEFQTSEPFIVRSQSSDHPFVILSYMSGATTLAGPNSPGGYGDPDVARVVPSAQYLQHYVFFTDPTYPETNLVVIRKRTDGGFEPVELDCRGELTGWTSIGSTGEFEFTRADLVRHNFEPQGDCDTGRREMSSEGTFAVWVWGWGSPESQPGTQSGCEPGAPGYTCYVSYAYPAGEGLQLLNEVEAPIPH